MTDEMNELDNQNDEKSFAELLEESGVGRDYLRPGQKVEAVIVKITTEWIFLALGGKSEGYLDRRERETPWLFAAAFLWGGLIATAFALPVNTAAIMAVAGWLEQNAALKELLGPEAALMIGAPLAAPGDRAHAEDVVARFRAKGALSPEKATSLYELGLEPADFMHRIGRTRDYKPQAMRLLSQKNVIRATEDGRVYLSEDELRESPLKKFARID